MLKRGRSITTTTHVQRTIRRMITYNKLIIAVLSILLVSFSSLSNPPLSGTIPNETEIELVLREQYLIGEIIEINIQNNSHKTYYTDIPDGECFFNFQVFESSGREVMLLNPLRDYDCNLKIVEIEPGQSLLLGKWKQQSYTDCNIKIKNSCPKRVDPDLYEIVTTLRAGGKKVTIRKTLLIV